MKPRTWREASATRADDLAAILGPFAPQLLALVERFHCGALCIGSANFNPAEWAQLLRDAESVMVKTSRARALLPKRGRS